MDDSTIDSTDIFRIEPTFTVTTAFEKPFVIPIDYERHEIRRKNLIANRCSEPVRTDYSINSVFCEFDNTITVPIHYKQYEMEKRNLRNNLGPKSSRTDYSLEDI